MRTPTLRTCQCGATPVVYTNPDDVGASIRCMDCWAETDWMPTVKAAIAEWGARRYSYQEPIGGGAFISDLGEQP